MLQVNGLDDLGRLRVYIFAWKFFEKGVAQVPTE